MSNAPVDVLAVMNTGAGHLYREAGRIGGEKLSAEMMEARAAVAELMEAANDMKNVAGCGSEQHPRFRRLHDALARVGGDK